MIIASRGALARAAFLATAGLVLSGCGSANDSGVGSTVGNLVMFNSTRPPAPTPRPAEPEDLDCPQVSIIDGGAAIRSQAGGDSGGLRYQIAINDVARECTATGSSGAYVLRVGVDGRVLAGPAGGAGSHSATLNIRVKRGTSVIAQRSVRVGGTIPSGEGGVNFSHVETGINVPAGSGEVEIEVGLGGGAAATSRRRRG